jgi:hypothetical protein
MAEILIVIATRAYREPGARAKTGTQRDTLDAVPRAW